MASRSYWQERFTQLEQSQINKGARYFKDLEFQYKRAAQEVEKEISRWYSRVALNNELNISEAQKLLSKDELEEFHWTVEQYIEKGRTLNYTDKWAKQLENASAKWHITRLEAMKLQMQQQVETLYSKEQQTFHDTMADIYEESYYRSAFELDRGIGIGHNFSKLDPRKIDKVLAKPWAADGANFSSRIWKQKDQLVNELQNHLTQSFMRGLPPDAAINDLAERFRVSKGQAGRLVMTETAFFHSAGQKDMFKELGVEEYEIVATLDNKTSQICQDLDGTHLPMSEYAPGVTAPPFHCFCRTTTVPYFDDEFTEGELRVARDEEGKNYHVPADMTYGEWKEEFVKPRTVDIDITENGKYTRLTISDINEYADTIEHEYITQKETKREYDQLWQKDGGYIQNSQGYQDINGYMRGLKDKIDNPKCIVTMKVMERVTKNNALVKDYIGFRKVDESYLRNVLGLDTSKLMKVSKQKTSQGERRLVKIPKNKDAAAEIASMINKLVGTENGIVTDKAFTSVSLSENLNFFTHYPIQFELQMPKGTRGLITSNLSESEFIAMNGSSVEILGAGVYNDGVKDCIKVYGRVVQ